MDFPLINGNRYGWASVGFDIEGAEQVHVTECTYEHNLEPGEVRGTGPQVAGTTLGEYSASGSITFNQEGWDELRAKLGDGYMAKRFQLTVSYADEGQAVTTDELVGCRITGVSKNPSQGTDGLTVECALHIMYIIENGVKPLPNMRL
jgi:hypothetical protein